MKSANKKSAPKNDKSDTRLYLYGLHAVRAALANPRRKVHSLLIALPEGHPRRQRLEQDLAEHPNPPHVSETARGHLDSLVGEDAVHQGLLAYVKPLPNQDARAFLGGFGEALPPLALLDQVTDPHNIGAILRSAAAFGIGALITPSRNTPGETGLIARIASGGLEAVPWLRVKNLGDTCEMLRALGYNLSGLAGEATQEISAAAFDLRQPQALVFGAEGEGLRQRTRSLCHQLVKLPTRPPIADLNVSNAAAISFFALRQSCPL